jgi:N6-adenosine-specific RNA methylase IME4
MADFLQLPDRRYSVIYADPPWAYRQCGATEKSRGNAAKHYQTMTTTEICAMPVPSICAEGAACFMWATFPNIGEAIKVMEAWGFTYKTAAFVWVKKNRKNGGNFWGMGAYTRANAEERIRPITNISVKRAVYETTMREFYRRIEAERKDRIERTGDPSYTEFEALLPWLVSFLLPEKKCRAVMEYDPAADRIKFFQEDDPAGQ